MICETCKGKQYPRQCRHSAAWRKAQRAPQLCPHGLALNTLPIGDNAPPTRPACRWLERRPGNGCCDPEYICTWRQSRYLDHTEVRACMAGATGGPY